MRSVINPERDEMEKLNDFEEFTTVLKEQACWADVCTEPGMVALMAARAAALANEPALKIEVHLSGGILKNALSAGLPSIQARGPAVAAAMGAVARDASRGLTILGNLTQDQLGEALALATSGCVTVRLDPAHEGVYGKCVLWTENHVAEVVIEGAHTNITEEKLDGRVLFAAANMTNAGGLSSLKEWSFEKLVDVATSIDAESLEWLLRGARSSIDLAAAGAGPDCCREMSFWRTGGGASACAGWPAAEAADWAAKAICARMNGVSWPVVTSAGSGNQGIMVGTAILSAASRLGLPDHKTIQALALAHGVNMFVKSYIGEVSCLCGGMSAGAGVAAAVCWMTGGTRAQMAEAVTEVLGSLFGMICDGAKTTCALKGWVAVTLGILVGQRTAGHRTKTQHQGVIGGSLEETLLRLEAMNKTVFSRSDDVLLSLAGVQRVS